MSIGVSNFDVELLTELTAISTIDPHLIQNHAELGESSQDWMSGIEKENAAHFISPTPTNVIFNTCRTI